MENVVIIGVANFTNGFANDFLNIDHFTNRFCADLRNADLAANDDLIRFYESLASDTTVLIDRQAGVENCIGNGVRNFIRMAFAD